MAVPAEGHPGRSVFHASLEDDLLKNAQGCSQLVRPALGSRSCAEIESRPPRDVLKRQTLNNRLNLLRFEEVIEKQRDLLYRQRKAIRDEPAASGDSQWPA